MINVGEHLLWGKEFCYTNGGPFIKRYWCTFYMNGGEFHKRCWRENFARKVDTLHEVWNIFGESRQQFTRTVVYFLKYYISEQINFHNILDHFYLKKCHLYSYICERVLFSRYLRKRRNIIIWWCFRCKVKKNYEFITCEP